jgi:hypothetical protein
MLRSADCSYAECRYAEGRNLFIILLNVIRVSVTILNVAETFSSFVWVSVTKEKRFITLTPGVNVIKLFCP